MISNPAVDGYLLELEVCLMLRYGDEINCSEIKFNKRKWVQSKDSKTIGGASLVLNFNGFALSQIPRGSIIETILILLPTGFPIIDVVLIDLKSKESKAQIYYIQITRSSNPFLHHKTPDNCSKRSEKALKTLMDCICTHLSIEEYDKHFVFFAPNCEELKFPDNLKTESLLFSKVIHPKSVTIPVLSKKRKNK
jgi:hypothetical protein